MAFPCVISIGMGDCVLFKDEELGREISLANSPWCESFIDGEMWLHRGPGRRPMMFRLIVRGRRAVIPLESNGRIFGGEATTVEYRGFGFAVFVSDLSLDTAVFGIGSEIGNFFGARGGGVGGSGDGVIDKSGKRLSCS